MWGRRPLPLFCSGTHDELPWRDGWRWIAPPVSWAAENDSLTWRCHGKTDFWRITEGHPAKHDGQALVVSVEGDFRLEADFESALAERYDEAGLFAEVDEERWLKLGVELGDQFWLSAVHTRGESDWSREPVPELPIRLGLERRCDSVFCSAHVDGAWRVFRVLHLPGPVAVGPYSCAPRGGGFETSMRHGSTSRCEDLESSQPC
jgi:regulation of enolase protein 1 (concanavalin A-like superfamily)